MLVQKIAAIQDDIDAILSIADAKSFMRIIGDDDNDLIGSMIKSAITEANDRTNRNLVTATFELYLPKFDAEIELPKNPIKEIVSIEYMDLEGNYTALDSTNYYLWQNNGVDILVFDYYLDVVEHKKAVKITFKSGFLAAEFPEDLKQWLKVRVSTLYEYREQFLLGVAIASVPHVDAVLSRYKIRTF